MCTFITLIAATDDLDGINAVLSRFDIHRRSVFDTRTTQRRAERFQTPHITAALNAGEREYLLGRGGTCDCGTYLGHMAEAARDPGAEAAAEIARLKQRGWTQAKITRALQDRTRAAQRQSKRQPNEDAAYWAEILTALCDGLALRRLGLMHCFENRPRGEKSPPAQRLDGGEITAAAPIFAKMTDGVIYDFSIGPSPAAARARR